MNDIRDWKVGDTARVIHRNPQDAWLGRSGVVCGVHIGKSHTRISVRFEDYATPITKHFSSLTLERIARRPYGITRGAGPDDSEDASRPHVVVPTPDGNVHVIPRKLIVDVFTGERPLEDIEQFDQVVRGIMRAWLDLVERDCAEGGAQC